MLNLIVRCNLLEKVSSKIIFTSYTVWSLDIAFWNSNVSFRCDFVSFFQISHRTFADRTIFINRYTRLWGPMVVLCVVFTAITGYLFYKSSRKPLDKRTPRCAHSALFFAFLY